MRIFINISLFILFGITIIQVWGRHLKKFKNECNRVIVPTYNKSNIYSGFLSVNDNLDSLMYFVFYGTKNIQNESLFQTKPLIIWLNGGPGLSSLYGAFYEIGPTMIIDKGNETFSEEERETTINEFANLLFIDQPLETGGSIADVEEDIPTSQSMLSDQFQFAIQEFFALDLGSKVNNTSIFLAGSGYATKNIINIAQKIIRGNNNSENIVMNLKGLILGSPRIDPLAIILEFGNTGYNYGVFDLSQKIDIEQNAIKLHGLIRNKSWNSQRQQEKIMRKAQMYCNCSTQNQRIQNNSTYDQLLAEKYLNLQTTQAMYQLKREQKMYSNVPLQHLKADYMASESLKFEWILNYSNAKILIYQGHDDFLSNNEGIDIWLNNIKFPGNKTNEFKKMDFAIWKLDNGTFVGNEKKFDVIEYKIIQKSGHFVMIDQQRIGYEMLKKFILTN